MVKQLDVSGQAMGIARLVDRVCRQDGEYVIRLTVPAHRRSAWGVEIERVELLRTQQVGKGLSFTGEEEVEQ